MAQLVFLLFSKTRFCIFQIPTHLPAVIRHIKPSREALWGGKKKCKRARVSLRIYVQVDPCMGTAAPPVIRGDKGESRQEAEVNQRRHPLWEKNPGYTSARERPRGWQNPVCLGKAPSLRPRHTRASLPCQPERQR